MLLLLLRLLHHHLLLVLPATHPRPTCNLAARKKSRPQPTCDIAAPKNDRESGPLDPIGDRPTTQNMLDAVPSTHLRPTSDLAGLVPAIHQPLPSCIPNVFVCTASAKQPLQPTRNTPAMLRPKKGAPLRAKQFLPDTHNPPATLLPAVVFRVGGTSGTSGQQQRHYQPHSRPFTLISLGRIMWHAEFAHGARKADEASDGLPL